MNYQQSDKCWVRFLTCATDFFYQKESEEGQECLTGNRDPGPRSATKLVEKMNRGSRRGHDKHCATADTREMKKDQSIGQRFWSYGWIG